MLQTQSRIVKLTVTDPTTSIFDLDQHTRQLSELVLSGSPMSTQSFKHIPACFPQLHGLTLEHSTISPSQFQDMLTILTKLEHLTQLTITFKGNGGSYVSFVDQLKLFPSLKSLHVISSTTFSFPVTILSPILMDKVNHLSLKELFIRNDDAAALACSLQEDLCSLKTLEFILCTFDNFVVSLLAKGIRNNRSLHRVVLMSNSNFESTAETVALAEALMVNTTLEVLDLSYQCTIPVDGVQALVESVVHNRKVILQLDDSYEEVVSQCSLPKERVKLRN